MSVSKAKHAGERDPNKHENNIQYRTYYRHEYNRDKKKRTNIYRTSRTEVIIVPETQDNDGMNSFLVKSLSQ